MVAQQSSYELIEYINTLREGILEACYFLRDEHDFDLLADLCGGDRGPEEDPRFEVNFHLFSTVHYQRLRLKVLLSEDDPTVDSVTDVWRTADWHERETYDLLGVKFEGHEDLRRILLPSDFDGHALRKDYEDIVIFHINKYQDCRSRIRQKARGGRGKEERRVR